MLDWSTMKDADIYGGDGNYLPYENAKYKARILKTFAKQTRRSGPAFIVNFEVLASTSEEVEPGEERSWYQGLTNKDIAFPSIKEFLVGLFRVNVDDKEQMAEFNEATPAMMEEFGDEKWENTPAEQHPLYGTTFQIETIKKVTESEGKPFTKHKWYDWDPPAEELEALLKKRI